jgi:hypothetical protein
MLVKELVSSWNSAIDIRALPMFWLTLSPNKVESPYPLKKQSFIGDNFGMLA